MKRIVLLTLLLPLFSNAQKYALIDKRMKMPIIYTDSVSAQQVRQGYFPVNKSSIDSFLANLSYLQKLLGQRTRTKMQGFELRNGETVITTKKVPFAYGDRYAVVSTTQSEGVNASVALTNIDVSNAKNKEYIGKMIAYITNNQSLFDRYREITPKIYNVYVISE